MRFNSSDINALRARAEAMGLVAWSVHPYPTSAYTHDGMFRYLGASRHKFHFHRMVEPDAALYVNTYRLHHRLLRPWVSCALDPECLAPSGAQVSCIFVDELHLQVILFRYGCTYLGSHCKAHVRRPISWSTLSADNIARQKLVV